MIRNLLGMVLNEVHPKLQLRSSDSSQSQNSASGSNFDGICAESRCISCVQELLRTS